MKQTCPTAKKASRTRHVKTTTNLCIKVVFLLFAMMMQVSAALGASPKEGISERGFEEEAVGGTAAAAQPLVSDDERLVLNLTPTPRPAQPAPCASAVPFRPPATRSVPASVTNPTAYPFTYTVNNLAEHLHFSLSKFVPSVSKQVNCFSNIKNEASNKKLPPEQLFKGP